MPNREDDNFDANLSRSLRQGLDASGKDCPEADLLAAYSDRSLDDAEYQRLTSHIAGCALCQRQLATVARITESQAVDTVSVPSARGVSVEPAYEEEPDADALESLGTIWDTIRFMLGPFPLSV